MTLQGNKESFNCLVDRYWPMAMALCLSRIPNVPEAEDITQEGFTQAYQYFVNVKRSGPVCRMADSNYSEAMYRSLPFLEKKPHCIIIRG
jgi:hypothetical protein